MSFGALCRYTLPTLFSDPNLKVFILFSLYQIAPVLFRKLVPKEVIDCFVEFHRWYKYAARYYTHTRSSLETMEKHGKKYDGLSFPLFCFSLFLSFVLFFRLVTLLRTNMTPGKIEVNLDPQKKLFDWDLVKVHAISHYREDITRSGSTHHYSAELYEHLHQKVC